MSKNLQYQQQKCNEIIYRFQQRPNNEYAMEISPLRKTTIIHRFESQANNIKKNNNKFINNSKINSNVNSSLMEKNLHRSTVARNLVNSKPNITIKSINETIEITPDVRKCLRPTINKINEDKKRALQQQHDVEDIHGPYNFRKLLRPAEYLPTESLRKRKGRLSSNGIMISKDKIPVKYIKRRAPLIPNINNKIVINRK
jgi:hypothetical protein